MSTYLTEEEQVEAIKAFVKEHSQKILWGILLLFAVFVGYRFWAWRDVTMRTDASTIYESLITAVTNDEHNKIHAFADKLIQSYGKTTYADFARLMLAKCDVNESQAVKAKELLLNVATHANLSALRQVARLRLARIQLSEKDYLAALTTIEQIDDKHYESLILELRGDIYFAQKDKNKAMDAYQQAKAVSLKAGVNNGILDLKL